MTVSRSGFLRLSSIFLLFFFHSYNLLGQPPIQWQKCFGGTNDDNATKIRYTIDGGYIAIGSTISNNGDVPFNNGFVDYWVVKINKEGLIEWQKVFGGSQSDIATSIEQTIDGGYIIAGHASSVDGQVKGNHGYSDFWVIRLDANGNLLWEKALGSASFDVARSIIQTRDGGFIVVGSASEASGNVSQSLGGVDGWVVKLDSNGNIVWEKSFGGNGIDDFDAVQQTADGGYIMTGYSTSTNGGLVGNHGKEDLWVVKIDNQGNLQWQNVFGGSATDAGKSIKATQDGGYILIGMTNSSDGDVVGHHGDFDYWLIKLDASGKLQWKKCYGGSSQDMGISVYQLADNSYIIGGQTSSNNGDVKGLHGAMDFWVIKINATGTILWQRCYGGANVELFAALDLTPDGWFVVCGSTNSQGGEVSGLHGGSFDFWVAKLGPDLKCSPILQTAVSQNNICMGTPVTFTATVQNGGTNAQYKWTKNNIVVGSNSPTYIPTSLRDGEIIICEYRTTTTCGRDTTIISTPITMRVVNDVEPIVTIEASRTSICEGSAITFVATPQHGLMTPSYQWLVNGTPVGTNSTTFSSSTLVNNAKVECIMTISTTSCAGTTKDYSNAITIEVTPFTNPAINITATATEICKGREVTFKSNGNGGSSARYQWLINGLPISNSGTSFSTTALSDGDKVNCTMLADPQMACLTGTTAHSNEIIMKVTDATAPTIKIAASNAEICEGSSIIFSAQTENTGSTKNFQWQVNGINTGTNASSLTHSKFSNNDQVTCILTTNNISCPTNSTAISNVEIIKVKAVPKISFWPTEINIMTGQQAQLNAIVSGSIQSFKWDPMNKLANPQSLTSITTPLKENTNFTLKVVAENGCEASESITVKVYNKLFIPTAFTPNGDGINDVFRIPPGALIELKEFSVFDRWGNKVFTTSDSGKGWDGTYKGNRLNAGTFVYYIKGTNQDGAIQLKGTLNLIY